MSLVTEDIRNSIAQIGLGAHPHRDPDESTLANAALILALSSIARHLDRLYDRLAHIEEHLEDLK